MFAFVPLFNAHKVVHFTRRNVKSVLNIVIGLVGTGWMMSDSPNQTRDCVSIRLWLKKQVDGKLSCNIAGEQSVQFRNHLHL